MTNLIAAGIGIREGPVLELAKQHSLVLRPRPPFNFDATVHKPSHFPSADNAYVPGHYWQTMRFRGHILGLRLDGRGDVGHPQIRLHVYGRARLSEEHLDALGTEIEYRFDLRSDLTQFNRRFAADKVLGAALRRRRGMRVSAAMSLYEFLIITVVLQNTVVRRSVQMLENLFSRYGGYVKFDNCRLAYFWEPEVLAAAPESDIRALRVGYRATALKRISELFAKQEIEERSLRALPNTELRSRLLALYGVGPASVGYLLFEVFHRFDAFDHVPPWEQKIYSRLLFDRSLVPVSRILRDIERRWGPWKTLAAHYVFEDLFWQRKRRRIDWLERLIRL